MDARPMCSNVSVGRMGSSCFRELLDHRTGQLECSPSPVRLALGLTVATDEKLRASSGATMRAQAPMLILEHTAPRTKPNRVRARET